MCARVEADSIRKRMNPDGVNFGVLASLFLAIPDKNLEVELVVRHKCLIHKRDVVGFFGKPRRVG